MSTSEPTPTSPQPEGDGQGTWDYTPTDAGRTSALPSTPSAPGRSRNDPTADPTADLPPTSNSRRPAGQDTNADATADLPPSGADRNATVDVPQGVRAVTQPHAHDATSPEHATGDYSPAGTPAAAPAAPSTAPRVRADRYTLKRFHAKGGMGEVWLAEDCDVGRAVALKRMRRKGSPEEQERFLREARITGQLEHPGIVPVHELGSDDNGQPIYVMKFVHGRTLGDVIQEYHEAGPNADVPREVQLLRLLESFGALCQTIAYSHSRGVLHRDIKPDNVMLGPYGETLVLDWGLAKVIGQAEGDGGGGVSVTISSAGDTQESVAGTIRGTPGYMPPEMASGDVEAIDQLSDVYLLGATLYHILAGRQPRRGKSLPELLDEAMKVPPPAPRGFDPSIPRPLEAICLKAMAFAKANRYPSAAALAEDLQRYLAGEPVLAYPEGWRTRAWRWAKRHRTALSRAAVGVLLLGVGLTAFFVVQWALEKKQTAEVHAAKEAEARRLQTESREQLAEFERLTDESRFYLANINPTTEQSPYFDPSKGAASGEKALAVAGRLADLPLSDEERDKVREQQYDLLLLLAQARTLKPSPEAAREGLALLERADTLRPGSAGLHRLRADCYQTLGEDRAAQERQLADKGDAPATSMDHFLLGEQYRAEAFRPTSVRDNFSEWKPNRELLAKALAEYRAALRLDPDHFWAHLRVGHCHMSLNEDAECVEALGACVALRPDSPWAYTTRGLALARVKRYADAEADFNKALKLDPDQLPTRLNRGYVVYEQADPKKEEQALADFAVVLEAPPAKRLIEAAYYRGLIHLRRKQYEDALNDFDRMAAEKPEFRPVHKLRALLHFRLKEEAKVLDDLTAYLAGGRPMEPQGAEACEGRGHLLVLMLHDLTAELHADALRLAAAEFLKASEQRARSVALYEDWGLVMEKMGNDGQAIAKYSEALKVQPDAVKSLVRRGWVYERAQKLAEARADFEAALRREPGNGEAHTGLGYVLAEQNAPVEALRQAHLATLYGAADYGVLHNVACIYAAVASITPLRAKEHENLALDSLRRSVEVWKRLGKIEPKEPDQMRGESAFMQLSKRPEFQAILDEADKP